MTLPGKLTIGFLQEDNPQKSYFRVRPLLIQDEGGYHPTENVKETYLEDGFIRIVPDKNEQSHFKTRMRTLGRYCAIDLRKHPGENDKIRPNKNHNGENGDRNAYIVYSDVITAVAPLLIAEIVEVDELMAPQSNSPAQNEEVMLKEGRNLLSKIRPDDYVIVLDLHGKMLSSEQFSAKMEEIMTYRTSNIDFVIGGSLGLSKEIVERADFRWKFSDLTFTHQMIRLLLLEQIYRAYKIIRNEPYHK